MRLIAYLETGSIEASRESSVSSKQKKIFWLPDTCAQKLTTLSEKKT